MLPHFQAISVLLTFLVHRLVHSLVHRCADSSQGCRRRRCEDLQRGHQRNAAGLAVAARPDAHEGRGWDVGL